MSVQPLANLIIEAFDNPGNDDNAGILRNRLLEGEAIDDDAAAALRVELVVRLGWPLQATCDLGGDCFASKQALRTFLADADARNQDDHLRDALICTIEEQLRIRMLKIKTPQRKSSGHPSMKLHSPEFYRYCAGLLFSFDRDTHNIKRARDTAKRDAIKARAVSTINWMYPDAKLTIDDLSDSMYILGHSKIAVVQREALRIRLEDHHRELHGIVPPTIADIADARSYFLNLIEKCEALENCDEDGVEYPDQIHRYDRLRD